MPGRWSYPPLSDTAISDSLSQQPASAKAVPGGGRLAVRRDEDVRERGQVAWAQLPLFPAPARGCDCHLPGVLYRSQGGWGTGWLLWTVWPHLPGHLQRALRRSFGSSRSPFGAATTDTTSSEEPAPSNPLALLPLPRSLCSTSLLIAPEPSCSDPGRGPGVLRQETPAAALTCM